MSEERLSHRTWWPDQVVHVSSKYALRLEDRTNLTLRGGSLNIHMTFESQRPTSYPTAKALATRHEDYYQEAPDHTDLLLDSTVTEANGCVGHIFRSRFFDPKRVEGIQTAEVVYELGGDRLLWFSLRSESNQSEDWDDDWATFIKVVESWRPHKDGDELSIGADFWETAIRSVSVRVPAVLELFSDDHSFHFAPKFGEDAVWLAANGWRDRGDGLELPRTVESWSPRGNFAAEPVLRASLLTKHGTGVLVGFVTSPGGDEGTGIPWCYEAQVYAGVRLRGEWNATLLLMATVETERIQRFCISRYVEEIVDVLDHIRVELRN